MFLRAAEQTGMKAQFDLPGFTATVLAPSDAAFAAYLNGSFCCVHSCCRLQVQSLPVCHNTLFQVMWASVSGHVGPCVMCVPVSCGALCQAKKVLVTLKPTYALLPSARLQALFPEHACVDRCTAFFMTQAPKVTCCF